ncbi:hypothetical protein [Agarilytica rhodophyticola]|uniref:hypothetical protein n=1 Tax=Agarilytica rhodophyticola TaxID=1737490 RepID=UPI000CD9EB6B|nr:hypothetical protein [Agarilytica rhodophyticola]
MISKFEKPNVVRGFSARFVFMCVLSGLPRQRGLHAEGASICGTSHNTFKNWCTTDKPPTFPTVADIVDTLLSNTDWEFDPIGVAAWLFTGDGRGVENPFQKIPLVDSDLFQSYLDVFIIEKIDGDFDVKKLKEMNTLLFDFSIKHKINTIKKLLSVDHSIIESTIKSALHGKNTG